MKKYLGIELGSTRIKAVLISENFAPVASGSHDWQNKLEDGFWTYSLTDTWAGLQDAYAQMAEDYKRQYGRPLTELDGLGISAMMHGYLPFDKDGRQLAAFRTWRNTTTEQAATILTDRFGFNVPQRWSVAHLHQAYLNGEASVKDIAYMTTLAGYVHWKLTGEAVLGVGDASGMFPIDSTVNSFNKEMMVSYRDLTGIDVGSIMPKVLVAGDSAGFLTEEGAKLLDPTGALKAGVKLCAPEGDAGTGMTATNSVAPRTGNVSAGTSIFAMIVLEKALSKVYMEIDMVTTPTGRPVAMAHCNSCTSDIDAWVNLLGEAAELMGASFSKNELYEALYKKALTGQADGGGLLSYNYYSGEPITETTVGRPLFARLPDSKMDLANFMRVHLYSSMATLKLGMDILTEKENVRVDTILGHGGLFKTKGVGQRIMATALDVPVAVRESASEGGAWGIALLAAYNADGSGTLEEFLDKVFSGGESFVIAPDEKDIEGFKAFMDRYVNGLEMERASAVCM